VYASESRISPYFLGDCANIQSDSIAACAALESDMAHIFGFERSQLLLLPETVDDYVGADNPVRFINASA
jgi:hypothetical protein